MFQRVIAAGVVITASLLIPGLPALAGAAGAEGGVIPIEVCGTLTALVPAGQASGSVTVGTRTYGVAPGTPLGNGGVVVAVGRSLCITAGMDTATGNLVSYLAFPPPPSGRLCGNVLGSAAAAGLVRLRADFGDTELLIPPGIDAGVLPRDARVCFLIGIDPAGDAFARARSTVDAPNDRQRVSLCGRVNAYVPATASSAGRVAIGSRAYSIEPGSRYAGDPAGERSDRTIVGSAMCLSGTIGDAGGLREYLTRTMDSAIGGNTFAYTPPSATDPGLLVISAVSRFPLKIPAGAGFRVDLSRGEHCFAIAVDASGDAAIDRVIECERGGVTAAPAVGALPSTSTVKYDSSPALLGAALAIGGAALVLRRGARFRRGATRTAGRRPRG